MGYRKCEIKLNIPYSAKDSVPFAEAFHTVLPKTGQTGLNLFGSAHMVEM